MRLSCTLKLACTATLSLSSAFLLPKPIFYHGPSSSTMATKAKTQHHIQERGMQLLPHHVTSTQLSESNHEELSSSSTSMEDGFDLETALFAAGLAFDSYVEPEENSSRWERGSKGMNVAFLSNAFTRNLYKGLVEVTPIQCSGLPEDDDNMEKLVSGGGIDACVMVAAIEGQWKEDVDLLKQEYHEGILDLTGAAHIGQSTTAWANVNENKSKASKRKTGKALPYHVPKGWGKDAQAVWPDPEPFFVYVQDPANVLLLFTLFDDDVIGGGSPIGSTYTALKRVLPQVTYSQDEIVKKIKTEILVRIQKGELNPDDVDEEVAKAVQKDTKAWEGDLKIKSKPRIKDKKGQVAMAMAAGAMVAGPVGAAVGGALGNLYEGQVKGRITLRLRYLPIPQTAIARSKYTVYGGIPGINWGELYSKYVVSADNPSETKDSSSELRTLAGTDLEHCFFINHDQTGGCCALYRSLEKKLIVVSFRGTCKPVDLLTDASIIQEPWIDGENPKDTTIPKVHVGFRRSMNSISRRLKELMLAAVEPGDSLDQYDVLVTGHSLGGALATLFVADIGEYGVDAGRALPQKDASDAWWKALSSTFLGSKGSPVASRSPPRPKSLKLYNFGSPRVGNRHFSTRFDTILKEGKVDAAYRLVNKQDVVARAPRTMGTIVDYDHCGSTVLVSEKKDGEEMGDVLWVEGETDDSACPVRDYEATMSSPTGDGSLLGDLLKLSQTENEGEDANGLGDVASKLGKRISSASLSDITSMIGFDKSFTEREVTMVKSLVKGESLAHHMEDSYYEGMGRAGGFVAVPNEKIESLS